MYNCTASNVGAIIRVETGSDSVEGKITTAFNPEPKPSPDRYPRGSVYEKDWAQLNLGTLRLKRGDNRLLVRALTKPGKEVMDLKSVVLGRL